MVSSPASLAKPTSVWLSPTPQRQVEPTTGAPLPDAVRPMLEIRSAHKGFVVFDTDKQEAIMRFDNRSDAANLVAELVIAESQDQLQAWQPPAKRHMAIG